MARLRRVIFVFIVLLLAVVAVLAATARPRSTPLVLQDGRSDAGGGTLWVYAHRGGKDLWPENTLYAFERALALGVDVLELDIHASRDGELVVLHDDTVDRTTDGSGAVAELTLAELKALDAGYRWSADGSTPYRGLGITIPTLREVLDAFPTARVNIEIKPDDETAATELCALLRQTGSEMRVLVGSFHSGPTRAFRRACPEVATWASAAEARNFYLLARAFLDPLYRPVADALEVPETQGGLRVVTPRVLRAARGRNMALVVWTVNDVETMRKLMTMGVDGIITDRPDRLLKLLGREVELELPPGVEP